MRAFFAAVLLLVTLPSLAANAAADAYVQLYQAGGWPEQRAHFHDASKPRKHAIATACHRRFIRP